MVRRSHRKGNMVRQKQKKSRVTEDRGPLPTNGKIFANGTAIEPVRDVTNPERLCLLYWDGMNANIGSKKTFDGQRYMPAPIDPSILRALTLPAEIAPYVSARKLLADISKSILQYSSLPENSVVAISRWALSSWFSEMQPAPGLSIVGPDTSAGRQLLQLLHCFCRHPLLLTEVNVAGLRALPTEWSFTLLIHQPTLSVEVQRMLSIARRSIGFIPRAGRLLDFHCAVATYTELGCAYGSGAIPSLEISVVPANKLLPILDDNTRLKIANNFQPKLLGYRLANFSKVLNSSFDAPELSPSMRELAQNLSACTPDDPDLQAQVPEFLRTQDKEIRSAAWLDINVVIIEAVLAIIHEGKEDHIYVGEITKLAEEILRRRDENRKLEPRAVGARLGALGLITEPRDSKGIRLVLTGEVSRHVHELAHNLFVPSMQHGAKRCSYCKLASPGTTVSKKNAIQKERKI